MKENLSFIFETDTRLPIFLFNALFNNNFFLFCSLSRIMNSWCLKTECRILDSISVLQRIRMDPKSLQPRFG